METTRTRATELLPSVLLTVLSMIQALALELLWSRLRDSPYLWGGGFDAALGWTQVLAMLLGFLQVWLFYSTLVMRFRWLPSIQDSVLPFGIGILEFSLIETMGPELLGAWFGLLALTFAASSWASYHVFRSARREPANREFFAQVAPATARDFAPIFAAVGGLAVVGVGLEASGHRGGLALGALLLAVSALSYQLVDLRRWWNTYVMGETAPSEEERP